MDVKPLLRGVASLAFVAAASGCGGHSSTTRLKIEVANSSGVSAYTLRCAPPGGTAPRPVEICSQLRREPDMLVGGPAIEHSCPPEGGSPEGFRVSGTYRGYPVDASFSSTECGWVPGQGSGYVTWDTSMRGAGPGVHERELSVAPTKAREAQARARRAQKLRLEAQQLTRKRTKALADGTLRLQPGGPPDPLAREILCDYVQAEGLAGGPVPGAARIYWTTRKRASVAGAASLPSNAKQPVYVLDVRYAYRDYMGHEHLDPSGGVATTLDPSTLTTTDVGYGTLWDLPGLGRPIRLPL
ncbi:MAG: hypothetical protein ACXVFC_01670 [Gaiellaceae bacterium]